MNIISFFPIESKQKQFLFFSKAAVIFIWKFKKK